MKKNVSILLLIIILVIIIAIVGFYFIHNFRGIVIDKYVSESPFDSINVKSNHVIIQTWYGRKDFVITKEDVFESLQKGKSYLFKKAIGSDWLYSK